MSRSFLDPIPIEPVAVALLLGPDEDGRYWCPAHNDRKPGGKPSASLVDDDPTILRCWSCGAVLDAVTLVMEVTGQTRSIARETARGVSTGFHPEFAPRKTVPPEKLASELRLWTEGVRFPADIDPVVRFQADRAIANRHCPPASYLQDAWGWRGDYKGRIIQPYWTTRSDDPIGLRFRIWPGWHKRGRPHSKFCLYGIWRLAGVAQMAREVWLCEGETDTTWTAFDLEQAGIGTAIGLPGASYFPKDEELRWLRGRTVVICFDDDNSGNQARERWSPAVAKVTKTINLTLDNGEDLCNTAESPRSLRRLFAA